MLVAAGLGGSHQLRGHAPLSGHGVIGPRVVADVQQAVGGSTAPGDQFGEEVPAHRFRRTDIAADEEEIVRIEKAELCEPRAEHVGAQVHVADQGDPDAPASERSEQVRSSRHDGQAFEVGRLLESDGAAGEAGIPAECRSDVGHDGVEVRGASRCLVGGGRARVASGSGVGDRIDAIAGKSGADDQVDGPRGRFGPHDQCVEHVERDQFDLVQAGPAVRQRIDREVEARPAAFVPSPGQLGSGGRDRSGDASIRLQRAALRPERGRGILRPAGRPDGRRPRPAR